MSTALWWIRRDLRLNDNQALAEAQTQSEHVVPVLCARSGPAGLAVHRRETVCVPGRWPASAWTPTCGFRGSRLIVRQGDPAEELASLLAETQASSIVAERDITPFARRRDERIARQLPLRLSRRSDRPPTRACAQGRWPALYRVHSLQPSMVVAAAAGGYRAAPAPDRISTPDQVASLPIPAGPALRDGAQFAAGEAEGPAPSTGFHPQARLAGITR